MVEHSPVKRVVLGPNPSRGARYNSAPCYAMQGKNLPQPGTEWYLRKMKFYYIYILLNKSKNFIYIGFTEDLRMRVKTHNNGENKSTKPYLPLELIHYEAYRNIKDAKRRELYLKSNRGKTTLKTMLREFFQT